MSQSTSEKTFKLAAKTYVRRPKKEVEASKAPEGVPEQEILKAPEGFPEQYLEVFNASDNETKQFYIQQFMTIQAEEKEINLVPDEEELLGYEKVIKQEEINNPEEEKEEERKFDVQINKQHFEECLRNIQPVKHEKKILFPKAREFAANISKKLGVSVAALMVTGASQFVDNQDNEEEFEAFFHIYLQSTFPDEYY